MSVNSLFSLQGQVALVTGGGGALGGQIARTLAAAGAEIVLAGRTLSSLLAVAESITALGGKAHCVPMDVAREDSIAAALDEAGRRSGTIGIVINNAGTNAPKPALEVTADDWDRTLDTNLRGCFFVARHCAQRMIAANVSGSIVNIASVLALRTQKTTSAYMASKAGLLHLTRSLAVEWADRGIRVNALLPGYFKSELTGPFLASDAGQRLQHRIPQRRWGEAEELAAPLLLLASAASSYMTGSALIVDGGLTVASI
jgi:NAD(P)-dependent dehydrogenase (short-subunit alcohol dehydrogenase family)